MFCKIPNENHIQNLGCEVILQYSQCKLILGFTDLMVGPNIFKKNDYICLSYNQVVSILISIKCFGLDLFMMHECLPVNPSFVEIIINFL